MVTATEAEIMLAKTTKEHETHTFKFDETVAKYAIPLSEFLAKNPQHTAVVVAAFVFHKDKLLMIQRSATERSFANHWEVAGGSVDPEDATILHGLQRELFEETGLRATKVLCEVGHPFAFSTGPGGIRKWFKPSFVVQVENDNISAPPKVTLNPKEHQALLWFTKAEIEKAKPPSGRGRMHIPPSVLAALKYDPFRLHAEKTGAVQV